MTSKRMKAFLLLGMVLLSLIASGCAREQATKPSETEPRRNTVAFHEFVNTQEIEAIDTSQLLWSYIPPTINDENQIKLFIDLFLKETQFTDDREAVSFDPAKDLDKDIWCMLISFTLQDGKHFHMRVSKEGFASLSWNEQTYYLVSPEKLDYQAIQDYGWKG